MTGVCYTQPQSGGETIEICYKQIGDRLVEDWRTIHHTYPIGELVWNTIVKLSTVYLPHTIAFLLVSIILITLARKMKRVFDAIIITVIILIPVLFLLSFIKEFLL